MKNVILAKEIKRSDVINYRNLLFVFGDNLQRKGYGGQAREMRDEPNSFGIATKINPNNYEESFFSDKPDEMKIVLKDLSLLTEKLTQYEGIVWPYNNIGTGRAELPKRSPLIMNIIDCYLTWLVNTNFTKL